VETTTEIVERALPMGERADRDVGLEPHEQTLVIEVRAPPPVLPRRARLVELLRVRARVHERPPRAATIHLELGRDARELVARLLRRADARARGEHEAQVLGEALVHPEELAIHRREVVARREPGGAAELSVPRVHVLVREQVRVIAAEVVVEPPALAAAVVARLVMLEPEVGDALGERDEEVVVAEVLAAEERMGLADEVLERGDLVVLDREPFR
jgi:hypothetical protein